MYVGQARGEDAGNVKLTEADVREIRRLVNVERVKIMAVAAQFGITKGHCSQHYVPFNTPAELQAQIALGIETWRTNTMPLAAYDFCRKHYSPEAIWTRVFEGLWPKPVD